MKNINNKGFTLVELIATIIILALVMGIGAYSITAVLNSAKEKDYRLLKNNIKDAVEGLYLECRHSTNNTCPELNNGFYNITLGSLVSSGFLKGNSTNSDDKFILVNPNNDKDISGCEIKYKYEDGHIVIVAIATYDYCPTNY